MLRSAGMQPFLGDCPKILPSCRPEQLRHSRVSLGVLGKGEETWHLSKTFRNKVTGSGCPDLLPAERHEAGLPVFSSIPVTCWHLPAEINCSKPRHSSVVSISRSARGVRGCSGHLVAENLVGSPEPLSVSGL